MEINEILKRQPILLFDGECGFCNKSIQFILKRERTPNLSFASLQSPEGQALLNYFEIDSKKIDSLILIRNNQAFIKSCAALRVTQYMKGLWPSMLIFIIIPWFMRNWVYDFIAKRRMKWFGRVEHCALLKQEDRKRFLDM
jgi:predicted DCC family thiol-disulfide oxidoreductase YuxK